MQPDARPSGRLLNAHIYLDLDRRLRESRFGGGAAEAHGVLCALACRGVDDALMRAAAAKAGLQPDASDDRQAIHGLYAIITRDLRADDFPFELMLPGADAGVAFCTAAVSDWCGGFARAFLYDGEAVLETCPPAAREALDDIVEISGLEAPAAAADGDGDSDGAGAGDGADADAGDGAGAGDGDGADAAEEFDEESLTQLAEIEEFLRVATQLIFEEMNPPPGLAKPPRASPASPSPAALQ